MKKERLTKVLVVGGVALALILGLCTSININARGKDPFGNKESQIRYAGKDPFGFAKLLPMNQLGK